MKERIIRYAKMTARLALRAVSVIGASCFLVLLYGGLAIVGAPSYPRHGEFDRMRRLFKNEIEVIEDTIILAGMIVFYVLIYIYLLIKGCTLYLWFLVMVAIGREKFKTFVEFSKVYAEKIKTAEEKAKTAARRNKLKHADLKKEPEEKNTNELIEETEGTACAPRSRRRKKKRRSKKWRKKK